VNLGMRSVQDRGDLGGRRGRGLKGQIHWSIVFTGVTRRITSYAAERSPSPPKQQTRRPLRSAHPPSGKPC
jgi:hypothetical protein